jgi:hypothetical protein
MSTTGLLGHELSFGVLVTRQHQTTVQMMGHAQLAASEPFSLSTFGMFGRLSFAAFGHPD